MTENRSAQSLPLLQRDHRLQRGQIRYTSQKPDRMNQERGREWYTTVRHADGSRTISAHCEIDDRPCVMRDITYAVDANWMPQDCFVRLSVADRFRGSGWFRFHPTFAECESFTALEGRVSQRMDLHSPLVSFQNHAIACDSWHLRLYPLKRGPGRHRIEQILLSSPDHRGATGPLLFSIGMNIDYLGAETITVGAGTFEALHFQFPGSDELPVEHPPYDMWCTADGEYTFLKGGVAGYMQTYYELIELQNF